MILIKRFSGCAVRSIVPLVLAGWMLAAQAQVPSPATRYISDETAITLRQDKGVNAPVAGLLQSGTRVELLESDSTSGYARVRVSKGRDGWVLARYLSTEPGARERLSTVEGELAKQVDLVARLKDENARLRGVDSPAAMDAGASTGEHVGIGSFGLRSEAVVMATGAGLFLAGLLVGLIASMMLRDSRRGRGL
ncbi:MAG: TIGR04211 family SH3 domain-containing protein [Panacagrimonas sp.]